MQRTSYRSDPSQTSEAVAPEADWVDECPVGMLVTEADGRISKVNPAAAEILGATRESALDQDLDRLIDAGFETDDTRERGWLLEASDEPRRLTLCCRRTGRWFDLTSICPTGPDGQRMVYWTDVSKQIDMLRQREQYFRSIIESSVDLMMILSDADQVLFSTHSIHGQLGFSSDEVEQQPFEAWLHPDDRPRLRELAESKFLAGEAHHEMRLRHRSEGYRIFELRGMDMRQRGKIRGRMIMARDITQRRRAEEALRESEVKYRRLFDQSRDIVSISDLEGRLVDVNRAGVEFLGYGSKEEVLALDIARQVYVDPDERERVFREVQGNGYADFESRFRDRSGAEKVVSGNLVEMLDDDGQPVGYLGILHDVTAERQAEEQLRQSQKMEAIGRLAGGIAHDFNNMLTAINGYCDLLLEEANTDSLRTYAREIASAGSRAADLTAKLLGLSRREVVVRRVISINEQVRDLESLLSRLIGEDIRLRVDLGADVGQIRIDPGQLDQALLNLAVNARDAMPKGGRLELRTRTRRFDATEAERNVEIEAGEYVCISVTDTGHGMDARTLEHVFEPFFTTKEAGKGTGLGLATVYATIRQYDGHIEVGSKVGKGTTFDIYLPRVDAPAEEVRREVQKPADLGRERILLVEDDMIVRQLLQEQLKRMGYQVLAADGGVEALEIMTEQGDEVDLLISDVVMPNMSGPELAARLLRERPRLPVLFVSGYTDAFIAQHGFSESEHEVLQKPFGSKSLAAKVRSILDRHEAPEDS